MGRNAMTPNEGARILRDRRAELLGRMHRIEDQLDRPAPKDWEDAATEAEDDQMLEALGAAERAEVARIDAALSRIADGTWGVCVKCGADIPEKRLALLPETPFCPGCAG